MDYVDFDLDIDRQGPATYQVRVRYDGEDLGVRESFELASDDELLEVGSFKRDLDQFFGRSLGGEPSMAESLSPSARTLGAKLFRSLFRGAVLNQYQRKYDVALDRGQGLRIRLNFSVEASDLAALPWELVFDEERVGSDNFLALYERTPILRYLAIDRATVTPKIDGPLRILGIMANPRGDINWTEEKSKIKDALAPLVLEGAAEIVWIEDATFTKIENALREQEWHVVHFVGHGTYDDETHEGVLLVLDDNGAEYKLRVAVLARELEKCPKTNLVVLNSCEGARTGEAGVLSSAAAALLKDGVPAVVAMQHKITNEAAVEFAGSLYKGLADGTSIVEAVTDGRQKLDAQGSPEWATPVLFLRAKQGKLFELLEPGSAQLGENAPKKVDRRAQVAAFSAAFNDFLTKHGRKPQVYVISGESDQGHEPLVDRLTADHVVPKMEELGGGDRGYAERGYLGKEVPWADDRVGQDQSPKALQNGLFLGLREIAPDWSHEDPSANKFLRSMKIAQYPVLVLEHSITSQRWTRRTAQLISWYVDDFWGRVDSAEDIPLVLVFLRVEYPGDLDGRRTPQSGWNPLAFLKPKKEVPPTRDVVRQELSELFAEDALGSARKCPALLLRDLGDVDRSDVQDWLSVTARIRDGREKKRLLKSIFGEHTHLPFEQVMSHLEEIIENLREELLPTV